MRSQSLRAMRLVSRVQPRPFSTTATHFSSPSWSTGPSPPRLPKEEQEEFERLQRASTGAFSTPKAPSPASVNQVSRPPINQSPQSTQQPEAEAINARVEATGEGDELHPDIRRGAKPEFEGDKNPKTGEVGGPKNEPLRWGSGGDWSYNGRVTDF
ncbi:MAG: hypothetical protein M1819_002136 [Sarea resinae]|nr:MAG: hypothetical protein M1819_002136 [Sarea resinae]